MWTYLFVLPQAFKIPPVGRYDSVRTAPFHPAIHNLGNVGPGGRAHAQGAWIATRIIDLLAYRGTNMRRQLSLGLSELYPKGTTLLEVGCGVGTLTYELESTENFNITAIDTSQDMLNIASSRVNSKLICANAVDYSEVVDLSIMCMVAHEMPQSAHEAVLQNLRSITRKEVWVIDIDPHYKPSLMMLSGEPYVPEYLNTFEPTLQSLKAVKRTFAIVKGHVKVWVLESALIEKEA